MKPSNYQQILKTVLVVGAPLALAVLELVHPHPHEVFELDLQTWLVVHYLQLPLMPLAALAMTLLLNDRSGLAGALCRACMFVFAVSYTAFDTAAGLVTGELVKAAQATGTPQAWEAPVMAVWRHPILGGAPGTVPLLAVLGAVAWLVGALGAAVAVRRAGSSWIPVGLLVISGLGLVVFRTHAWPGGPLTFGSLAAAAAWLQWERTVQAKEGADLAVEQDNTAEEPASSLVRP
jgi:hypothetical protein